MDEGRRGVIRMRIAIGTELKVVCRVSTWMREAAEHEGLAVVWSHLEAVDEMGFSFATAVRGPRTFADFHRLREQCTLRVLSLLQAHGVCLPSGAKAKPVALVP
mmetsp:Transcript_18483/g.47371  ORF Transcript_18483/g.47371 Transcript_18483/m.47371 type:complete len:104 (-) Transcript_18483:247-558(-)